MKGDCYFQEVKTFLWRDYRDYFVKEQRYEIYLITRQMEGRSRLVRVVGDVADDWAIMPYLKFSRSDI